ncbi:alpha-2-macroglobulin family protein [Luteolibacter soli]|uniref:MG2 domain-containing protein n=1 Tax=Luteolibacter soli TaxID=3135280 RepID=A0ABU9AP34_9BACT
MSAHRRGWSASIATILILTGGTWYGMRWWESHKPRVVAYEEVQKVTVTSSVPEVAKPVVADKDLTPAPFVVHFSLPSAPLEKTGKAPGAGVTLKPEVRGKWLWTDNSTLTFTPDALHWSPATTYTVTLDPSELAPNLDFSKHKIEFTTPPLLADLRDFNFYTSPKDPSVHQVVGEVRTTHPVELDELTRHLSLTVMGNTPVFTQAPDGTPLFTVTQGESQRQWFVRSRNLVIPEIEDFMKLRLSPGLVTTAGGKPMEPEREAKTRVPDKFSGFKLTGAETRILRTDEGEPQQFLFINTDHDLDGAEIASHITAWWRDNGWTLDDRTKLSAQLANATKVKLTPVASDAPLAQQHAFRFVEPRPGTLLVRVEPGVKAPGGFEMARRFETLADVPEFPKEVNLLGKGNVLALGGARKLVAQSRGIDHLQVTFSRVPVSQIQHLITQNRYGEFSAPDLNYSFSEENIVQRWRKIVDVPHTNDWEAVQTEIDFHDAPPMTSPDALAGGRGIFLVGLRPVTAVTPEEEDKSVYGRIEAPSEEEDEGGGRRWEEDEEGAEGIADGWKAGEGTRDSRFVMVTDLGLVVKAGADGRRDVFVMSLTGGVPVEGVALQALARNGTVLAEVKTDTSGHANFESLDGYHDEREPIAIVARKAEDITFLPLKERQLPAMDYSRFDIDGVMASRLKAVEAFLFTERGVYRPGDSVPLGTLVRRRDWEPVIEGLPVRISMTDSRGRIVSSEKRRLPFDGFFEADLKLADSAALGKYELAVHVINSADENLFRLGRAVVRVEEFQPDRMKVETHLDPAPPAGWLSPAATVAKVNVRSLFGEAAAERRVTMKLDLSPGHFSFEEWPAFTFYDRTVDRSGSRAGRTIDLGETKTDGDGVAEFKLPLETLKDASFRLAVSTEAFEREGGRSVRHELTELVSPWDQVLGWKSDGELTYLGKDAPCNVELVAIDRSLKAVAMPTLRRRLIEISQVSALTKLENGNYSYVSTERERMIAEETLSLPAASTPLALATGQAGNFRLEIIDAEGVVMCAIPYRVAGKGDANRSLDQDSELELVLGKGEIAPGEEVEVHLTAPYAGSGIVTVERDRVLLHQWFHTETNETTLKLRVPEGVEGTVYINAAFVRSPSSPEIFRSPLSYAAEPLRITPRRRQLEVKLDTPQKVRPGSEAKFGFTASQPSRLVLYAVDEGIHQITNYKLPRPLDYFTRKQALEVRTLQWLDLLLPEYQFLKAAPAFGGDADDGASLHVNPFKRRQEAPVVFWSGIVDAGPERREVSWQVPDYFNGNLRVMAVAANASSMGVAESNTLAKAPIILMPNAPLFVSPGDEFEASLAVTNNLEPEGPANISLSATPSSQLERIGEPQASLDLQPGKEGMAHFRFKAKDDLGGAEIKFVASANGETILRTITLSVRPASHHLTKVTSGWFRTGSYDVKTVRSLYPQFRRVEATGSSLPLGLARGLEAYVSEFPHGCSEQITSRAMVKLVTSTEADFGLPPAVAAEHIKGAIAQLANRQQSDGGFGYWYAGAPRMFEFQSLYVLHFLTEAKLLGHPVPETMMTAALQHAADTARANIQNLDQAELQAYAIYLLARNGTSVAPQLLNLRDTLAKRHAGNWEGQATGAWMAASYRLLKQDKEAKALMADCVKRPHPAGPLYCRSKQAEELKIFYVRCRHFPEDAAQFGLNDMEPVMSGLRDESFNTLTASFTVLALKAYSDAAARTGLELSLYAQPASGDEVLLSGPKQGLVKAEFPDGTKAVEFRRDQKGSGDLGMFFQTVEQGYDRGTPPGPLTSGVGIVRELKPVKEDQPLRPGDAVDVTLTVRNLTAKQLPDLAVIDLLPAGFEVLADDLKSGAGTVAGTDYAEVREDRSLFYLGIASNAEWKVRYRMKAVSPGSFTVPPAMVEDMYDRGRHGVSAPGRIEVVAAP